MKWAEEFINICFQDLEQVKYFEDQIPFSDGEFQLGSR